MPLDVPVTRPAKGCLWSSSAPHRRGHRPPLRSEAYPVPAQLGRLRRDIDSVKASGVFTQELALDLRRQIDVVLLLQILRQFERHELLDQPFGRPNRVVAA